MSPGDAAEGPSTTARRSSSGIASESCASSGGFVATTPADHPGEPAAVVARGSSGVLVTPAPSASRAMDGESIAALAGGVGRLEWVGEAEGSLTAAAGSVSAARVILAWRVSSRLGKGALSGDDPVTCLPGATSDETVDPVLTSAVAGGIPGALRSAGPADGTDDVSVRRDIAGDGGAASGARRSPDGDDERDSLTSDWEAGESGRGDSVARLIPGESVEAVPLPPVTSGRSLATAPAVGETGVMGCGSSGAAAMPASSPVAAESGSGDVSTVRAIAGAASGVTASLPGIAASPVDAGTSGVVLLSPSGGRISPGAALVEPAGAVDSTPSAARDSFDSGPGVAGVASARSRSGGRAPTGFTATAVDSSEVR